MDSRIPAHIQPLLDDYTHALDREVPDLVTGLYIHGSIALNAYVPGKSDIDTTAFLSRPAITTDLEQLQALHQTHAATHPRPLLEVSYVQWSDLGKPESNVTSPIYHDGNFKAAGNFDVNLVTWWIIKQHGITLIGPQSSELPLAVDWSRLIQQMHTNLNSYWARYLHRPRAIAWFLFDYGIEWIVLGVLRQYYSFVANDITSKHGAGEYALAHLPEEWHRIIREALRIRHQEPNSCYKTKLSRAGEAYNFVRYIIQQSNEQYCHSFPQ